MRNSPDSMGYPLFLGPADHLLPIHYRRLNRLFLILSPLIFLANEFFVRPDLVIYRKTPEASWSIIALALNAQVPVGHGMTVIVPIALYSICLATNLFLLPKWGPRPTKIGMKSGLPPKDGYEDAYFGITNSIEKFAFMFWNSVFVPVSFIFASFIPCMFINLIRGLS